MKTYQNKKHGFELDMPDEWFPYTGATPLLPTILFTIAHGWTPKTDVEFSTGPNEYLNVVVETLQPEPSPAFLEQFFRVYAQQNGFTDCTYGRISMGNKEHVWARYQIKSEVWLKKYMIVLNRVGYAITASWAGKELLMQKEKTWDEIAASLRTST
jgi:hypothetical protein